MSIASELQTLQTNMTNAYNAISSAGGTVPASQNLDNLATAIATIPGSGPYTQPTYYAWIKEGSCNPSGGSVYVNSGIVYTRTLTAGAKMYTAPSTLTTKPTASNLTETTDTLQNITYGTALGVSSTFAQSVTTSSRATYIHRPVGANQNFIYDII